MCHREVKSNLENDLKQGFTHGGVFHADDVFATALLKILNPAIEISRGFSVPEDFSGIVYDIGGGKYDHHQKGSRMRDNGIPYAAFGLLWEAFGQELLCRKDAEKFDRSFVQPLDQSDNTGAFHVLSLIIADMIPTWQEESGQMEEAFWKAVAFARKILERRFRQIRADREAYHMVYQRIDQCRDGILYLERVLPWKDAVQEHGKDIFYVIYPSIRGGYNIQAVPDRTGKSILKRPFPQKWRGADAQELQGITGICDLTFCHMSGFLCTAETLEGARRTAWLAMQTDWQES